MEPKKKENEKDRGRWNEAKPNAERYTTEKEKMKKRLGTSRGGRRGGLKESEGEVIGSTKNEQRFDQPRAERSMLKESA